jgi:hypothetical protein
MLQRKGPELIVEPFSQDSADEIYIGDTLHTFYKKIHNLSPYVGPWPTWVLGISCINCIPIHINIPLGNVNSFIKHPRNSA